MYYLITAEDFIRIPAERLGKNIENIVYSELERELSRGIFEADSSKGVIVAIEKINHIGEGKIIPGDGGVYFDIKFTAVADVPTNLEFVRGTDKGIMDFGVFIDIGTLDGLCHISQVFDDYANYDERNKIIVGKETGKKLMVGDEVKARINTISWRGDVLNTKIGLTMRQPYLGKDEWAETDKKIHEKAEKMKEKESKPEEGKEDVKKEKDEKKEKKSK